MFFLSERADLEMHEWYNISCLQKKFQFPEFVLLPSFRGWWADQKLAVNLAIKASHRRRCRLPLMSLGNWK